MIVEGSNRLVEVYNTYVYKIPRDGEAIFHNRLEARIWERSKCILLASCTLKHDFFIEMERVLEDVSQNKEGVFDNRLSESQIRLLKKHKKLEYGFTNGQLKIYDYADCELDWGRENPEDMFLEDLEECLKN
jgi:hypothetical protein